jgi:hypothetical protein
MTGKVVQYRHVEATRPIWLPDGRNAQTLRLKELWPLLQDIPGVNPKMGKAELLDVYELLLLEKAEALTKAAGGTWRGPTEGGLKAAAKALVGSA